MRDGRTAAAGMEAVRIIRRLSIPDEQAVSWVAGTVLKNMAAKFDAMILGHLVEEF